MVRRADHVITCSRYMASHVSTVFGVSPARITPIQNGIDPRDLEPVASDLEELRARYAEPGERLVLLVGRLVYEKGFHLALDALAPVIAKLGGIRFVVAGTGTAETELRRQAKRLGLDRNGVFLGWVGDDMLHSLYRISDLCIVPSIYEPFGLVALEAMASGCLCVVADTGGLREVVPGDGTVGLRFARATRRRSRRCSSGCSPTTTSARSSWPKRASTCCASTGARSLARRSLCTAGSWYHHGRPGPGPGPGRGSRRAAAEHPAARISRQTARPVWSLPQSAS